MIPEIIFFSILIPVAVTTFISIYNFFTAPTIYNIESNEHDELISVLIPARNEEKYIGKCLSAVLRQSHSNIEVLVLDDNSDDSTSKIVLGFSKEEKRVRLIHGEPLPHNWLGKNWACSQLAHNAKGNTLLFIDADVILKKNALQFAFNKFKKRNVKFLSVFPTQEITSIGNYLTTPLMNWLLLSFLPLKKVFTSSIKSFVAANGQFILFDKKIYDNIGGHNSVKDKVVEDMELARILKKRKDKIITCLGGDAIFCKMYNSFDEGINGFSKNFYSGFNTVPIAFLFVIHFFLLLYFLPAVFSLVNFTYMYIVGLIITSRIVISISSGQNFFINVILHLPQMIVMYLIGWKSLLNTLRGKVEWKGRKIN